jgi:poly(hydroxyalkanoate) depolymerase family esterase
VTVLRMIDMKEATRLTRLGRLAEAMAVLRGEPGSEGPAHHAGSDAGPQAGPVEPEVLDMRPPNTPGGSWTSPFTAASANAASTSAASSAPNVAAAMFRAATAGSAASTDLGAVLKPKAQGRAAPMAPGARFEEATFSNACGSRAYKLYVPSGYNGRPVPLVVMLHGCTQSPDDFAAGTKMNDLAEEQVFLVAYPAQSQSANASKCWNWFHAGHQQRDEGEPSLIAGITRRIMRDFTVDDERVYIAGLSAGGAAAAIMGSTYPDLYAAIGVHSGLACGAAADMPSAFAAMSQGAAASSRSPACIAVPTIVFHGDQDRTVSPVNGDQIIAQCRASGSFRVSVTHGQSTGGVGYQRSVHTDENGVSFLEQWVLHGAGHAWSGGDSAGSYTDPRGPDASREMMRFFLQHRLAAET